MPKAGAQTSTGGASPGDPSRDDVADAGRRVAELEQEFERLKASERDARFAGQRLR